MTYFEQIEVIAKTTKVTCKRPLTSTEKAAYGIIFDLCKRGRELEAENADLKNQLRDALERC